MPDNPLRRLRERVHVNHDIYQTSMDSAARYTAQGEYVMSHIGVSLAGPYYTRYMAALTGAWNYGCF